MTFAASPPTVDGRKLLTKIPTKYWRITTVNGTDTPEARKRSRQRQAYATCPPRITASGRK